MGKVQKPSNSECETLSSEHIAIYLERREADHSPPTSAEVKKTVDLYIHSPTRLHGVVLN
jgi:hypothetical protein